jgi:hypothetical protein
MPSSLREKREKREKKRNERKERKGMMGIVGIPATLIYLAAAKVPRSAPISISG